jgi:hypothetical protein
LNAGALSEAYEHIPVNIDMATFRTLAIVTELATADSSDPELFETVAELSMQPGAPFKRWNGLRTSLD